MKPDARSARVIVVDDEAQLREPLAEYLAMEGYDAAAADGGEALDRLLAERPADLVVLDINMPGENGFSIAQRLRREGPLGIIMLTAKSDLVDRVVGLEVGADDYVAKPCDPRELVARVRAVLRRMNARPADPPMKAPADDYVREFWVKGPQGALRVSIDTLERIEADKDYVLLHTGVRSHILRMTMTTLAARLDPKVMLRVHRSAFVRPDAVQLVRRRGRSCDLVLKSGAEVGVSPQHLPALEARLGRLASQD